MHARLVLCPKPTGLLISINRVIEKLHRRAASTSATLEVTRGHLTSGSVCLGDVRADLRRLNDFNGAVPNVRRTEPCADNEACEAGKDRRVERTSRSNATAAVQKDQYVQLQVPAVRPRRDFKCSDETRHVVALTVRF